MSKCLGCGSILSNDINQEGYTKHIEKNLCERCFRIRNYNEYKTVVKDNQEYFNIIDRIGNDLIVLVIDIFDIPNDLDKLLQHLNSDILLVLTKFDLMPSTNESKFINYFKNNYQINPIDCLVVSANKNYNMDELYSKINKHNKTGKVYFVGYTNAGKSTIINKLIYNYSDIDTVITTSSLPSTTLNTIEIKLDSLTLIDTPGIVSNYSIINYVDGSKLKKIVPRKKIRPISYSLKTSQTFLVDDLFRIDCKHNNNLIFYISNELKIKRCYKSVINNNLVKQHVLVPPDSDIVIPGLGFVHIKNRDEFDIYIMKNVKIYIRDSII